jgi:predicted dehydrogenase
MGTKIGVGIIGAGAIADWHAMGVGQHGGAEVVAVFDVQPERARQAQARWAAAKVAPSPDELVSDEAVDAVIVATPPAAHARPTIAALEAGKHVLCEKPFALTPGEAATMVRAAEGSSGFLACASARLRCTPAQQAARRMIDRGELGDVYHAHYRSWRLRGRPGHHVVPGSTWFLDRSLAGGGVIMDVGVYAIDSVLWMLGDPVILSVTAQTRRLVEEPVPQGVISDVEDHAVVMLQCEDGKSALVETAWVTNMAPAESFVVLGTKAGLRLDPLTKVSARRLGPAEYDPMLGEGNEITSYRSVEEQLYPYREFALANMFFHVTTRFLDDIGAGVQPQTTGAEALTITRTIDAAYRSARLGRSVALSDADLDTE